MNELVDMLKEELPELDVKPLHMDYFEALKQVEMFTERKNITMFLGSNIGNFKQANLELFLTTLQSYFKPNDKLFLGVDLKKNPETILRAYNDPSGITASFNMNLLTRMNKELGADFDLAKFQHYALYDPENGEARSYIVSLEEQNVNFSALNFSVNFEEGESIHTEISRKYSLKGIDQLAQKTGFTTERNFLDTKHYYVNTMWEVVG